MMWRSSHSSLTFAEAECSSISDVQVPVSILEAPSLAAVNGPMRLFVSVLYMKSTEPFGIALTSFVFSSAQVNIFLLRHCPREVFPQKRTYPVFMNVLLFFGLIRILRGAQVGC